jgi:hypothetical protein
LDAQTGSEIAPAEVEEMARRLMSIMDREIDEVSVDPNDWGEGSIARLDLGSLALVGFLVAVEDELSVEWDPDVDIGVMRSFDAMARYVIERCGGSK